MLVLPGPRVFGATPLDHVAKKRAPTRGASFPTLHNKLRGFCTTQMRPLVGGGIKVLREGAQKKRAEGEGIALGSLHKRDRTAR